MLTPDLVNGIFEIAGSVATWGTFRAIRKDKGYAGIRLPIMAFFTSWGFWNLYYYSHLFQWFSLFASLSLTAGNVAIICAMIYYGRKK